MTSLLRRFNAQKHISHDTFDGTLVGQVNSAGIDDMKSKSEISPIKVVSNLETAEWDLQSDPEKQGHKANIDGVIDAVKANEVRDVESDDSPYPEVRAVVSPLDDQDMPVNTLRAWTMGIIFTMLGSGVNQFFSMRYPSVTITSLVAQLVSFPIGVALAKALPLWTINLGPLGRWCINPDHKFNVKEHTLVTVMANISFTSAWATDIIQAQVAFYGQDAAPGYQILLVLTCQIFGLGIAGLAHDVLVKPAAMIWPSTLANVALFTTLHSRENKLADGWSITRMRYFLYVFAGAFVWYWFPGYLFTALTFWTGLGFFPLTFDWSQVAYNLSPILFPINSQINIIAGWFLFFAVLPPILYYTNTFQTAYLPMSSTDIFDNSGKTYNVSRVVIDGVFDPELYKTYSPPFLTTTYAIAYGLSFAVLTASPVYVFLYHGKDIWASIRGRGKLDVHARLMENYRPVPRWWYALITLIVYGVTIATMESYHIGWPAWGVTIALLMVVVFILPVGVTFAITNQNTNSMTVLGQLISGYVIPGRPIVALAWKFYAYTGVSQAVSFSQDMKLAYYMKLPRRTTFFAQLVACFLGAITQVGVLIWMLNHIPGICQVDQSDNFICPQGRTNFAASILWGAVGPARLYSPGKIYSGFLHMFWIGALCPVVTWLMLKRWPNNKVLKNINWVVFFGGTNNYPPATGINYTSWFAVGFLFNWYIKRRKGAWWQKYAYVTSAALDVGLALAGIIIFFALGYNGISLNWWGNTVYSNTADGKNSPIRPLPAKGYFGPDKWE
ncbi:hypothetical protein V502_09095 [Pseudogymnoascus sp. VKM F-4520 (FW-2644)]|nr:hypothetical protein V502_09095 [Pseudogymnoascus sp. VKM F-4520 (FW-2644)]